MEDMKNVEDKRQQALARLSTALNVSVVAVKKDDSLACQYQIHFTHEGRSGVVSLKDSAALMSARKVRLEFFEQGVFCPVLSRAKWDLALNDLLLSVADLGAERRQWMAGNLKDFLSMAEHGALDEFKLEFIRDHVPAFYDVRCGMFFFNLRDFYTYLRGSEEIRSDYTEKTLAAVLTETGVACKTLCVCTGTGTYKMLDAWCISAPDLEAHLGGES